MDCHQKIKLALAADMLLAQQVIVVALMILLMFDCDCQQAEAEKAKAAAPPPGVNLSTNNQTFLKAQILFANFAISFPPAPAPEAPAVIVNVVAAPPQVGDRDRQT